MTDKPTVVEALSAVMADVQAVRKGDRNLQQGYIFRGIDAVVNAVGPVLRKHGVLAVPVATEAKYRDVLTSTGKPSRECTVIATYRFYGPAGDFIECQVPGESMDFGDKGAPKAMSVAYRILLLQALCIPTDDPEPDAQSYERGQPPRVQPEKVWDPIEQQVLLDAWISEIDKASSAAELAKIGKDVLAGKKSGEMSPNTYATLVVAGGRRKGELNGSDLNAQSRGH